LEALGLLKVRRIRYQEALPLLAKAAALEPNNTRYSYVYAVALKSIGQTEHAIRVLEQAHQRRPADRQVLTSLVDFERENGNLAAAIIYAEQLVDLVPDDPRARDVLSEVRRRGR
jgi:Flp pilus assembly protein TadD